MNEEVTVNMEGLWTPLLKLQIIIFVTLSQYLKVEGENSKIPVIRKKETEKFRTNEDLDFLQQCFYQVTSENDQLKNDKENVTNFEQKVRSLIKKFLKIEEQKFE